jgi:hypothetical protein
MVLEEDLERCSRGDLKHMVRLLMKQVETLEARVKEQDQRIAELEARLNEPPKNSGNSSVPPSKGFKANKSKGDDKDGSAKRTGSRKGSLGRKGHHRPLSENPDKIVRVMANHCGNCRKDLSEDAWQICLAHQLRDCQYAIETGDTVFAPRMKRLILRAFVIAERRKTLAASTRRAYKAKLEREMDAIMALPVEQKEGRRLRKRYGKHRGSLFTFLDYPEIAPDNNSSERTLRPTATYRKVTGGFRSIWGADLYAAVRSSIATAAKKGSHAFHAIQSTLGISKPCAVG